MMNVDKQHNKVSKNNDRYGKFINIDNQNKNNFETMENDVEEYIYGNQINSSVSHNSVMGNRNTNLSLNNISILLTWISV